MNKNISFVVALVATVMMSSNAFAQPFSNRYTEQIGTFLRDKISFVRGEVTLPQMSDLTKLAVASTTPSKPTCYWVDYSKQGMNFIYPSTYAVALDEYWDDVEAIDSLNQSIDWLEIRQWLTINNLNDLKASLHMVGAKDTVRNAAFMIGYANAPIMQNFSVKGVKSLYNILFGALYFAVAADEDEIVNIRPMHRTNYGGFGGYAANCDLVFEEKPAKAEFFISIQGSRVVCIVSVADSEKALIENTRALRSIRLK